MVNPQPLNPEDAAWDMLNRTGLPKFDKFADENPPESGNWVDKPVGTSYEGVVAENPKRQQAWDFDKNQPKTFEDGNPIWELHIVLNTDYRDPANPEDDGRRILRAGRNTQSALQQEMKRLGIKNFGVGTRLKITFTGYRPSTKGGRASKLVNIELQPTAYVPSEVQQAFDSSAQTATQQAAAAGFPMEAQQQPVQPVQQPVQQAPQQQVIDLNLLAAAQAVAAQAPPQSAGIVVTQEHVDKVKTLMSAGNIPRDTAIQAVANTDAAGSEEFRSALDALIPF